MLDTTLKYLTLCVLPSPKFRIPRSDFDPVYRAHRNSIDQEASLISQHAIHSSRYTSHSTPFKINSKARLQTESRSKRRNTIGCSDDIAFETHPQFCVTPSHSTVRENSASQLLSGQPRFATPDDSPIPALQLFDRTAPPDSPTLLKSNDWSKSRATSSRKGKEKRNSAPPILPTPYHCDQRSMSTRLIDTNELFAAAYFVEESSQPYFPTHTMRAPISENHGTMQNDCTVLASPYASKLFESALSPILEDICPCVDPLDLNDESMIASTNESSVSSYGQLLDDMAIDHSGISSYGFSTRLVWQYDERGDQSEHLGHQATRDFGMPQGSEWKDDYVEESILVPELRLTIPTPEMGSSVEFRSLGEGESRIFVIDEIPDYRSPEAEPLAPTSSASRPLGTEYRSSSADTRALALGALKGFPAYTLGKIPRRRDPIIVSNASSARKSKGSSGSRWSFLRSKKKSGKGERVWSRFSRVLSNLTGYSIQRRSRKASVQLSDVYEKDDNVNFPGTSSLPNVQCNTNTASGQRSSVSSLSRIPTCILEDGEHAASRLFGLPDIGDISAGKTKIFKSSGGLPARHLKGDTLSGSV
ncbi:hypothetical protein CPB84DRAFT_1963461 [Gymnopilus junonius]|uniref:Uncharacterized protein n=1 Tax=Gymnopilus junonius TaxID=109634 RepID=A0A9P5NMI7_GYMJU|nr:hypothetical protein CPB84DRAFT_1963461 [Gymnopilus junonius]